MINELEHDFRLDVEFDWDEPIGASAQLAIATYGNDEDRLHLISHHSVTADSLDALSRVSSVEVRYAIACNASTPLEALMRLTRDPERAIKIAANNTVDALPEDRRLLARGMVASPIQRLKSRHLFGSRAA